MTSHSYAPQDASWSRFLARRVGLVFALSAVIAGASASAAPKLPANGGSASASERMLKTLDRRGDLTLRDSTLEAALFTISELWGINIVAGEVPGAVNGVFKDAPLREILDSILISNGYAYRPVGESLVISRLADLGQINPFFVSATIPVGAAEVGEVVDAARLMTTPQGQVRAMPSAGAVLVVDFPDRVQKIRELIQQIDGATRGMGQPDGTRVGPQRLEVAYFHTHFVPATDAQVALNVVLSPQGRIAAIDDEDRLLVVDYAENLSMVESVLARIDRPRPQVKIQALIYDINLTDIEEIGVNWNALTSGTVGEDGTPTSGDGGLFNTVTKAPFDAAATGGTFTFFSLNANVNLEAIVLALQQADDSRLLASPNVVVVDNEQAVFESVSEIPFQQLTQTGAGGQIGTTSFRDAGIKLTVTPKIASDRSVDMQVSPEFSRLTGFTPGDNQPIIDRRTATTRVRVSSGQTLMIGGLRQRNDVGDFDGIPLLKDIRYLGHLFRARETQIQESELVVFITPEIVGYSDPLNRRDQLAADTIHCRLDRIPAPEGCPPCGPCAECSPYGAPTMPMSEEIVIEGPTMAQPAPQLAGEASNSAPVQPEIILPGTRTPSPADEQAPPLVIPSKEPPAAEATRDATRDLPASEADATPPPPEAALIEVRSGGAAGMTIPLVNRGQVRRLPPVVGPEAFVSPRSGDSTSVAATGPTPSASNANPLRKRYDERFRAEGLLYGPRVATNPEPAPEQEEPKSRGRLPDLGGLFWR